MSIRRACLAIAIVLAGCSSKRADQPDPAACVTVDDCASGPLVDPDDICCDSGMHLDVFSRKYLAWRGRIRASECNGHHCPSPLPPTLPLPCATQPRCIDHRCTHSCPPVTAPAP
jgi:hypothetical protein